MPANTDAATTKENKACSGCGQIGAGHLRPWSKKCPKYDQYVADKEKRGANKSSQQPQTSAAVISIEDQLIQDAAEQNLMDEIGFDEANCEFANTVEHEDSSSQESVLDSDNII